MQESLTNASSAGLLFFFSVLLRKRYEAFSAILFSGAMAAFYFTTYGAFEYYGFLSRPIAFIIMMLLTFLAVFISLKYNRHEIAVLALVGSYGIPFLVGGNSGNVFMLFTYIFLINCGILLGSQGNQVRVTLFQNIAVGLRQTENELFRQFRVLFNQRSQDTQAIEQEMRVHLTF